MLSHGAFAWCDLIWYVVDGTGRPSIDALLADLPAVSAQVSQPPSAAANHPAQLPVAEWI